MESSLALWARSTREDLAELTRGDDPSTTGQWEAQKTKKMTGRQDMVVITFRLAHTAGIYEIPRVFRADPSRSK